MLDSVGMILIILAFLIILHIFRALRNYYAYKEFKRKRDLTDQILIIPDTDKGEDFEEFSLYDPVVKYLEKGFILDLSITLVGILLIVLTIYLDYFTC